VPALEDRATSVDTPLSSRVYAVSTLGSGSNEEARILALLSAFRPQIIPFDRKQKWQGFRRIFKTLWRERPSLVVLEGTGVAGGVALLLGRVLAGVPYVVSSGDAVGPWVARQVFWAGPLFQLYERVLCRFAAGFIGWTPYLTGRAMTFGTHRAITAPGYAPFTLSPEERVRRRAAVRRKLGIPDHAIVFGLAGSLAWARRVRYCYGLELVQAVRQTQRPDLRVLVVGDGTGRGELERAAGERLGQQVLLPGAVPQDRVMDYLAAMDVASLPQSCDGVGNFRFTTKISEYLASGLPVVMGRNPMAYDLDSGYIWRLPGLSPWDPAYVNALGRLMEALSPDELAKKKAAVPPSLVEFDRDRQVARVTAFIGDLLAETADR
jgi:glycosyltransferase involved in cell wall biosynthesis